MTRSQHVSRKVLRLSNRLRFFVIFLSPRKNVDLESKFDVAMHAYQAAVLMFALNFPSTRVETLIVATIYLQLIQNRYMFRSFTVLHCSHQHCVQPVASDVKVVGYL